MLEGESRGLQFWEGRYVSWSVSARNGYSSKSAQPLRARCNSCLLMATSHADSHSILISDPFPLPRTVEILPPSKDRPHASVHRPFDIRNRVLDPVDGFHLRATERGGDDEAGDVVQMTVGDEEAAVGGERGQWAEEGERTGDGRRNPRVDSLDRVPHDPPSPVRPRLPFPCCFDNSFGHIAVDSSRSPLEGVPSIFEAVVGAEFGKEVWISLG